MRHCLHIIDGAKLSSELSKAICNFPHYISCFRLSLHSAALPYGEHCSNNCYEAYLPRYCAHLALIM
eukprot:scaffold5414_cov40-Tisochrysis_lutea.AAC.2